MTNACLRRSLARSSSPKSPETALSALTRTLDPVLTQRLDPSGGTAPQPSPPESRSLTVLLEPLDRRRQYVPRIRLRIIHARFPSPESRQRYHPKAVTILI